VRSYVVLFAVVLVGVSVTPARGQDPVTTITVDAAGHVFVDEGSLASASAFAAQAAPVTDLEMFPSTPARRFGAFVSRMNLVYICRDQAAGQNVNCSINLALRPVPLSGGHEHHDANRPKGDLSVANGFTGTNGFFTVYTAPEVGGVIELQVNLVFPPVPPATEGQPFSFVQTIGITVPGLVALPPGNWTPEGDVAGQHTDNHYGTPAMNDAVLLLADDYRFVFNAQLGLNDMSLVQGGLFDAFGRRLDRIWKPIHSSHRFGIDVDVHLPPRAHRLRLLASADKVGLDRIEEPPPLTHYHFRLDQKARP
jgi:hypothetical protein